MTDVITVVENKNKTFDLIYNENLVFFQCEKDCIERYIEAFKESNRKHEVVYEREK